MGRLLPYECTRCDGIIDWGDFGSPDEKENKPTCTCHAWYWDSKHQTWEYHYIIFHQIQFGVSMFFKRIFRRE